MNESHRKHLANDFRCIIGFIALCSVIGFFEFLIPLFDLFNHFRLQAIVGATVCAIISFFLHDKKVVVFALCTLFLNVGIVGYKLQQTAGISALGDSEATFSLISSNVLTSNTDYQAVIDMVAKENPDLVVFSEVDGLWLEKLSSLDTAYKYSFKFPRPDNFGLAAFSKKPFKADIKISGEAKLPLLILTYDDLTVIGAHPLPPASIRNMKENRVYMSDIATVGTASGKPVIVAGDLNATLWAASLNPLIEAGFDRINPLGIAYTWPKNNILFALQIDHFFAKNIIAADFDVLPAVGSDHYPIRADIVF